MIAAVELGTWDWIFLVWFLAVTLGVGLWYARRASRNLTEYFVSGRDLPWWMLGTSMVATTFAADTPLVVAGFILAFGVAKNWVWWCFLVGGTLTVFVFSRWWRRSGVTTEIELMALRYDGRAASFLRGFKAVYLGVVLNSIIIGWVTNAMGQIVEHVFDVPKVVSLGILFSVTLGYAALSGLWGVVAADVLQFAMAMVGAVLLAVLCVQEAGGLDALVDKIGAIEAESGREILALFPTDWQGAFGATVLIMVMVNWWAVYYPGAEPGGGGYIVQRMLAAKDERHARAGTLWYIFAHYVLRPWPWVLVGLAAMVLAPEFLAWPGMSAEERAAQPELAPERAYPAMFEYLPVGLLGLVVASFFAAFMSTITTQLNLAASYLVNDLYLPLRGEKADSDRGQVLVARLAVVLVTIIGCTVAWILDSVHEGWTVMWNMTAGIGLVLILRWLWWRVNAWSEIAAMLGSASAFVFLWCTDSGEDLVMRLADGDEGLAGSIKLLFAVVISTVVWFITTLCTRPVASDKLEAFYTQVRPGGWWGPVARATGLPPTSMARDLAMWGVSTVFVLGALLGIGSALLGGEATLWFLGASVMGGGTLWWLLRGEGSG